MSLPSLLGNSGTALLAHQFGPAHLPFYWHLPLLVVLISLVYSATRHDQWSAITREAVRWGLRLTMFLACIVVVLWGVARFLIGS
jgi:hypothetical protein